MKRAILEVSADFLGWFFIRGTEIRVKVEAGLPEDAAFCSCHYDHRRHIFQIVYGSEEFAEVCEGGIMPILNEAKLVRLERE